MKKNKHWRTTIIAIIALILFICSLVAMFLDKATFSEATGFITITVMPLVMLGLHLSADSKSVENDKYPLK